MARLWWFYAGAIVFLAILFAALVWAAEPRNRKRYALQLFLTWVFLALLEIWRSRR